MSCQRLRDADGTEAFVCKRAPLQRAPKPTPAEEFDAAVDELRRAFWKAVTPICEPILRWLSRQLRRWHG